MEVATRNNSPRKYLPLLLLLLIVIAGAAIVSALGVNLDTRNQAAGALQVSLPPIPIQNPVYPRVIIACKSPYVLDMAIGWRDNKNGTVVSVSEDGKWANGYWRKVVYSSISTDASGFVFSDLKGNKLNDSTFTPVPGKQYRVTTYDIATGTGSSEVYAGFSECARGVPGINEVVPSCIAGGKSFDAYFDWRGATTGSNNLTKAGTILSIDDDNNWDTGYWRKTLDKNIISALSTNLTFANPQNRPVVNFILVPGRVYKATTYYLGDKAGSNERYFGVSSCANSGSVLPGPTVAPPKPSSPIPTPAPQLPSGCNMSADCGPGYTCVQPPMPPCKVGMMCPQVMPAKQCVPLLR